MNVKIFSTQTFSLLDKTSLLNIIFSENQSSNKSSVREMLLSLKIYLYILEKSEFWSSVGRLQSEAVRVAS